MSFIITYTYILCLVIPDLIILPPKSPPTDDGYSTGSQNGSTPSTLYSPHSFITSSNQENTLNKKLSKVSKKFSIGSSQKSKKGSGSNSPAQVKKQTNSNSILQSKPSTPAESKKSVPIPDSKETEHSNMNTLTREEINDLNDLLSDLMFDDKEHVDPSLGIETTDHPSIKTNNQQMKSTAKNLSQPPPYLETRTLGRKPKPPYQTQAPVETTLQRSKSEIYGKRIEPDTKEQDVPQQQQLQPPIKVNIPRTRSQNYDKRAENDSEVPRRPMGRSQTLTRPARRAYTRSLDREKARKGKNMFYSHTIQSYLLTAWNFSNSIFHTPTIQQDNKKGFPKLLS